MKRRARRRWRGEEGASYVIVLIAVAVLGMVTATAAQQWTVVMKREREAEFWFRAQRIQRALERYGADSEIMKATRLNRYPLRLDDLTALPKRYVPVIDKDPLTGDDFEIVRRGAEIIGVRSRSGDKPMDKVHFGDANRYRDVLFQVSTAPSALPGSSPDQPPRAVTAER